MPALADNAAARSADSSFSADRNRSTSASTRAGSSLGCTFSDAASWDTRVRSAASRWNASIPTAASTRRRPDPTEDSAVIATGPICDECSTWVPPHSSTDHGPPISTIRTVSS